ncbi:hypothetical protein CC53_gp122 [Rhizobium phage vB_RleS_L338C]|uniref:hypothetical protein n=1 Tax=Rhizobium phage vB_RleS_L338C TaxID=1414737 RepID=UPI0003D82B66|nr:hypothetical protein CC53_gp122 [Rhizobium phage vB_RleS_L338C]AHC30539.1 hypothetical protein L338C_122 [Rhizobium phage vB_RleS_L338C]QNH72175.1 hypothetical protein P11VFA_028 [Rhizobium phage P11VFA]
MKPAVGQQVRGRLPFITGIKTCVIVARRVPKEGEYAMSRDGSFFRRQGSKFLSKVDAAREYWIIEEVK